MAPSSTGTESRGSDDSSFGVVGFANGTSNIAESVAAGAPNPKRYRVAIPRGVRMGGNLGFDFPVRIEGEVSTGVVFATATVVVGREARVSAQVVAESILIEGHIEGEIVAARRIELFPGSSLTGALRCSELVMHEGSTVDGAVMIKPVLISSCS